jgi:hypothetical protein
MVTHITTGMGYVKECIRYTDEVEGLARSLQCRPTAGLGSAFDPGEAAVCAEVRRPARLRARLSAECER